MAPREKEEQMKRRRKRKQKKRETLSFFFLFPFSPLPHQISLRRPEHKLHRKKGGDESCYGIVTLHDAFFQKDLYS
jgi:predicted ATP-dependent protease